MLLINAIGVIIYKKEGMGFGDVKLFAAIGILTGFPGTIYTIFISIIIASLGFIVTIIVQKINSKNSDEPVLEEIDEDNDIDDADKENIESDVTEVEESKGFYLAFGPYIAIGTIIYICFFNLINNAVSMYLALFK